MEHFKLEKPDISELNTSELFSRLIKSGPEGLNKLHSASEPEYFYWDRLKYKALPDGFTAEEYWATIKFLRRLGSTPTAIKAEDGSKFTWNRPSTTEQILYQIDRQSGGMSILDSSALTHEGRQKFIARGVLEEAIASSQLEGASSTRKAAKKMIAENRRPTNESEHMIFNNYQTMRMLEQDYKNKPLTLNLLFEMHAMLTQNTLPSDEVGRLRTDDDEIIVARRNQIVHVTPNEEFLKREMEHLIAFANDEDDEFTHPVVKAIFLHFWIGYLHPFTDGNGRLARALFYWYLLKNGYWVFMYLPISTMIKRSSDSYAKAYIYSEQDDKDLTYFFTYVIKQIMSAVDDFETYVKRVTEENRLVSAKLGSEYPLNDRQKQLLHYLVTSKEEPYTSVTAHGSLNDISRGTAISDLHALDKMKLLKAVKSGRFVHYYASEKLLQLIKI